MNGIFLDTTTRSLQVVLGEAISSANLPWVVSYKDTSTSTFADTALASADGATNGTTAVTMAAAPGATTTRQIIYLSIVNADVISHTVKVIFNDNATLRNSFIATIAASDVIVYSADNGFQVFDSSGRLKTVGFGLSGYSGTSGTSGTSGFSGTSGTSGFSGTSGTSGTSGFSGKSGTSGYSGTSGTSGYSGTSGTSGFSGTSGTSGFSGTSGTSGFSGKSGTSGFSGTSGTSGFSGTSGTSGVAVGGNFYISADQFDNPITANWAINALAPVSADTVNSAIPVRRFDDTAEEGVGFIFTIPTGTTNITFNFKTRAQTAPGSTQAIVFTYYTRTISDNAAITAWSSAVNFTALSIPTNANFQYDTQTISLATLGLTAGNLVQFEITRRGTQAGDTLTGDADLAELVLVFS